MALPEQIRKQTEAADEILRQLNADREQGSESEVPVVQEVPPTDTQAIEESFASDSATQQSAVEQTADDTRSQEETYEHKYRTLQGKYNVEIPRLQHQNRDLVQRMQQLEQLLASMSSEPQSRAPQGQPQAATAQRYVTDEDVADYGDSIEVMRKVTREEVATLNGKISQLESLLQQVQTNVVPQVQAVAQRQAMSAEQQFWRDLTVAVPLWREINDNADFQTWLLQIDPLSGINRQTYLDDAQRSLDAGRVSQFFSTWLEISGQAVAQQTGSATRAAPAAASELERQVSPGRSRSSGAPATPKGRVYTRQDVTKFFEDVRKGTYAGREKERDQIERDIFAAQQDGRLQ